MALSLTINGQAREIDAAPGTPLLWVLRDHLGLTGSKFGCGVAQCGACTVHIDGAPVRSCVTPHESVEGMEVTTIEGASGAEVEAIQAAWTASDVPQCGYCQSGQILAAAALLKDTPNPTDTDIDDAMSGNICRCATYMSIRRAIKAAAKGL